MLLLVFCAIVIFKYFTTYLIKIHILNPLQPPPCIFSLFYPVGVGGAEPAFAAGAGGVCPRSETEEFAQ
jgi:hypothetical protein